MTAVTGRSGASQQLVQHRRAPFAKLATSDVREFKRLTSKRTRLETLLAVRDPRILAMKEIRSGKWLPPAWAGGGALSDRPGTDPEPTTVCPAVPDPQITYPRQVSLTEERRVAVPGA